MVGEQARERMRERDADSFTVVLFSKQKLITIKHHQIIYCGDRYSRVLGLLPLQVSFLFIQAKHQSHNSKYKVVITCFIHGLMEGSLPIWMLVIYITASC